MSSRTLTQPGLMTAQPEVPYSEWHFDVFDLPACPFCGHRDLVVRSIQHRTSFYVTHHEDTKCLGTIEGPRCPSKREAAQEYIKAMQRFSASFRRGDGGEW